jgi:hypothetical protein
MSTHVLRDETDLRMQLEVQGHPITVGELRVNAVSRKVHHALAETGVLGAFRELRVHPPSEYAIWVINGRMCRLRLARGKKTQLMCPRDMAQYRLLASIAPGMRRGEILKSVRSSLRSWGKVVKVHFCNIGNRAIANVTGAVVGIIEPLSL